MGRGKKRGQRQAQATAALAESIVSSAAPAAPILSDVEIEARLFELLRVEPRLIPRLAFEEAQRAFVRAIDSLDEDEEWPCAQEIMVILVDWRLGKAGTNELRQAWFMAVELSDELERNAAVGASNDQDIAVEQATAQAVRALAAAAAVILNHEERAEVNASVNGVVETVRSSASSAWLQHFVDGDFTFDIAEAREQAEVGERAWFGERLSQMLAAPQEQIADLAPAR